MAFFGQSGPSPEETQQALIIKSSLTENLKEAIKHLQRQHINSEESIHSEDTANALCNVLEAIFLHGLKASFSKKLSSIVGGINEERDFNFWEFVSLFTHRDTVTQLNRLGQITTRVGMCRAWVRLALNDGLLESYLDAMLRDKKTLLNHYRRISYLRDPEQPEIMKSLAQGISNFRFELSYNSSVLNIWTSTPLILAGLADNTQVHTPEAIIRPAAAEEMYPGYDAASRSSDVGGSSNAQFQYNNASILEQSSKSSAAHEQYFERDQSGASGFINTDYSDPTGIYHLVSESKQFKVPSSSPHSSESFGTATSQISMPDPVDNREFPHERMSPKSHRRLEGANTTSTLAIHDRETATIDGTKKKNSSTKPKKKKHGKKRKKKVEGKKLENQVFLSKEKDEDVKSFTSFKSDGADSFISLNTNNNEENTKTKINTKMCSNPFFDPQEEYDIISTGEDEVEKCTVVEQISKATLSALDYTKDDTETFPVSTVSSGFLINKIYGNTTVSNIVSSETVTNSSNQDHNVSPDDENIDSIQIIAHDNTIMGNNVIKASISDKVFLLENDSHSMESSIEISATDSFKSFSPARQVVPLEPELSNAVAMGNEIEVAEDAHEADLSGSLEVTDDVQVEQSQNEHTDYSIIRPSPKQQSNSLSHSLMQGGWSSPLIEDGEEREDDGNVYDYNDVHSLLPEFNTNKGPRISTKVIDMEKDLPGEEWSINTKQTTSINKAERLSSTASSQSRSGPDFTDSIYEEYEILEESGEITTHLEHTKATEFKDQLGQLPLEKGLDLQNFQCYGCKRSVGMFFCQPRICAFNGANYCYECHENDEFFIPARIVLNWDFRKHLVCKDNLVLLRQFEDSPLLNVFQINPRIYDHVKDMTEVKELRQQLRYLKAYLFTCKQSIAEEFRQQVWPKEYLYDDVHIYSVLDLLQVPSGQLATFLKKVIKTATQHVYQCRLCSQKGFICEICHNPKVIYPFEIASTRKCTNCDAVYHKNCKTSVIPCPKCRRILEREIKMGKRVTAHNSDYAYAPDQCFHASDNKNSSSTSNNHHNSRSGTILSIKHGVIVMGNSNMY